MANKVFFLFKSECAERGGDYKAEVEGGDGVHCLISLGKAFEKCAFLIHFLSRSDIDLALE